MMPVLFVTFFFHSRRQSCAGLFRDELKSSVDTVLSVECLDDLINCCALQPYPPPPSHCIIEGSSLKVVNQTALPLRSSSPHFLPTVEGLYFSVPLIFFSRFSAFFSGEHEI